MPRSRCASPGGSPVLAEPPILGPSAAAFSRRARRGASAGGVEALRIARAQRGCARVHSAASISAPQQQRSRHRRARSALSAPRPRADEALARDEARCGFGNTSRGLARIHPHRPVVPSDMDLRLSVRPHGAGHRSSLNYTRATICARDLHPHYRRAAS